MIGALTSNRLPSGCTLYYGLIADGIHTHPSALRVAQRVHPKGKIICTVKSSYREVDPLHCLGEILSHCILVFNCKEFSNNEIEIWKVKVFNPRSVCNIVIIALLKIFLLLRTGIH